MELGVETGGGVGHDPCKRGRWDPPPRESTLTWRLGQLGSYLPLTLDLRPGSATFWVTIGTHTPSLCLNCFICKVGMRIVPASGRIVHSCVTYHPPC